MRLSKVRDYLGNEISDQTIPAGAFVVDTAQPYGRMANALLEPETPSDPEFIKRQEQKRKINDAKGSEEARDEYDFIDATAWSLPLTMGVEAFYADETPRLETSNVELADFPILRTRTPNGELKEESLPTVPEARTAYLFDGGSQSGARLAFALLQRGYRLATSNDAFRAEGKDFARGTIIVRVERNPADLYPVISELGRRCGVPLSSISSAFIDQGFEGIGSESVYALRPPKVAVLAGDPASQTSFGLLRFLLEQIYGLEFVPIAVAAVANAPLDDFNVLILPAGEETRYERYLGDKETKRLKEWVSGGGVLIAVGEASEFAVSAKLTASRILGAEAKEHEKSEKPKEPKPGADERKPTAVPGALMRATINRDHFLSIGCKNDFVPVLVRGDTFYKPTETGANVLTFSAEKLKLSGFVWPNDTEELLQGTVALIDEPLEGGRVILFSDEPGSRLVWMTTTLFLRNAILFGPSQPKKEKQW
jgi:hypothetical protein